MSPDDMQRFEIGADREDRMWIACGRCPWNVDVEPPLSLAELVQRAEEHTEVCR